MRFEVKGNTITPVRSSEIPQGEMFKTAPPVYFLKTNSGAVDIKTGQYLPDSMFVNLVTPVRGKLILELEGA